MATSVFAVDSASRHRDHAMAEMNITPLVDVMLVLLIIFMVAAPLATRSIDLRLPQVSDKNQQTEKPPQLDLLVQADGSYLLDGVVMSQSGLRAALADAARGAPGSIVAIAASENADYQAFTTALAAARTSGIRNIQLVER